MKFSDAHLGEAVERGILSAEQSAALIEFLRSRPDVGATFDVTHLLYYFGGLVAIGAMTLFMNVGWEAFGGWGIFCISLLYAGVGLYLSRWFQARAYAVPAGICATFVVALTPLGIYGLQLALGWWPDETPYREYHQYIGWHWLYLELGTLAIGLVMAWVMRYPFMVMPLAATLWYLSMDVAAMITGGAVDWAFRAWVSLWFGLVILLIAVLTDLRARGPGDYAFWLYLFGLMAFWGGLSWQDSDSELGKLGYFAVNALLIGCGALLARRAFVVFGGLGCAGYLGHLASEVFAESWLFPVVLAAIGFSIVYLGVIWQRNEVVMTERLRSLLPRPLRERLHA